MFQSQSQFKMTRSVKIQKQLRLSCVKALKALDISTISSEQTRNHFLDLSRYFMQISNQMSSRKLFRNNFGHDIFHYSPRLVRTVISKARQCATYFYGDRLSFFLLVVVFSSIQKFMNLSRSPLTKLKKLPSR